MEKDFTEQYGRKAQQLPVCFLWVVSDQKVYHAAAVCVTAAFFHVHGGEEEYGR